MASKCSRIFSRASVNSVKAAVKTKTASFSSPSLNSSATSSFAKFSIPSKPAASPLRRFSLSRMPSELGGVQSMMPLHSAVATARMTSCLSSASRSCRALSQDETDGT